MALNGVPVLPSSWLLCFSWYLAYASTSAVGAVTAEPGGKLHRVSLPCFQTWHGIISQNGSGVIPVGVSAPTPFPIIYFFGKKKAIQKHRIIKYMKLVLGCQRIGFIFETGRQDTSEL